MTDFRRVETERLVLTAVAEDDLAELHALHADPRVWTHLPSGVHADEARTRQDLDTYRADWERDALGYWTVRRPGGTLVGIGGVRCVRDAVWNVYYRLSPEHQGHGYATEIVTAARAAATDVAPDRPVVAYLLDHNEASRRVAERCGLHEVWQGPDREVPGGTRLVFADRPLPAETLTATT